MSVAFDSAELRALNAVNIDYDLTFMQVASRDVFWLWPGVRLCVILISQFLECLVAVSEMMEKSDVVSLSVKVQPRSLAPRRASQTPNAVVQVEALMQALTGDKGVSRPATRHSKAPDGADNEGKGRAQAARCGPRRNTIAEVGEGQEETEIDAAGDDGRGDS